MLLGNNNNNNMKQQQQSQVVVSEQHPEKRRRRGADQYGALSLQSRSLLPLATLLMVMSMPTLVKAAFVMQQPSTITAPGMTRRTTSTGPLRVASSSSSSKTQQQDEQQQDDDDLLPAVYDADQQASRQQRRRRRITTAANNNNRNDPEWQFFDTARLHVAGGDGGTGCVAFRREKGEPRGGPSGGRGGRGGNVWLECNSGINTLLPLRRQHVHVRAANGKNGQGKNKQGVAGQSVVVKVPAGTIVRDLQTQKLAGELSEPGQRLLVAAGGRGGRGNAAFLTARRTSPKLAERGEPGAARWLSLELRLVADVGFLGMPNAGKSTLLAAASAARPKIANYPFTTIVPNLGVCNVLGNSNAKQDAGGGGTGLVLCDIPGLIPGAAQGAGMGGAFLRHVQRCKVLLHVIDGTSEDPVGDFKKINAELQQYDAYLAKKPQVVVLNKVDVTDVQERQDDLIQQLRQAAGHSRVLSISAATTHNVQQLMQRLHKFVQAQQPDDEELPPLPEIDLTKAGLDYDADEYEIQSDPAYPGQWRVSGQYIEQLAKMTHWEYPEAVERFGRQLAALGISKELQRRGAADGDLIMIDKYDFDFAPGMTNPYIPAELLQQDNEDIFAPSRLELAQDKEETTTPWRPFPQGGFLDVDQDELLGFGEMDDWDLLEQGFDEDNGGEEFVFAEDDEVWTS